MTGLRYVYLLAHKSDVFQKLKEFLELTQMTTGNRVNVIRSDNGTEYTNKNMQEYMKNRGIVHERSSVYTPERNGRSE